MMRLDKMKQFPWHSYLFSLFPILALAAYNINEINIRVVFRPLFIALAVSFLILVFLNVFFKDWQRAGLLATAFLILFFSYGHVYNFLHNIKIANIPIGRNRILAIIWLLLAGLCVWFITKLRKGEWVDTATRSLNLISTLLIVFQLGSFLLFAYQLKQVDVNELDYSLEYLSSEPGQPITTPPDIYYIILDAYGRSDVLKNTYAIDNTVFINQLQDLGFYIADCSMSNYANTKLSLSSTLNFNYLPSLSSNFSPEKNNNDKLISLLKNSATRRILEEMGYESVAFATGYQWTEWENADYYYSSQGYWRITEFEDLIIRSSAGLLILDAGFFNIDQASIENVRGRTLYALEKLDSLSSETSPKFVFTHLIIPHIPFVFGPTGEMNLIGPITSERQYTWEEYKEGYGNQVKYINSRIVDIVKKIINDSKNPPIIIIQGDHGPGYSSNSDRMAILNAYYFPNESSLLYDNITPVNTFRVIFNDYFQGNFELLQDDSFFSRYNTPFEFEIIPNNCLIE